MRRGSIGPVLRLGLACIAALALPGCIRLEQKLMLNGDGSMAMSFHYSVAADSAGLLATGAGVIQGWPDHAPKSDAWFTSEDAVRKRFEGTGVRLQQYRSYVDGGRQHVELQLFAEAGPAALNAGLFGPFRCARLPNGRVRLWAELPPVASKADGLSPEALTALAQDLYLSLEVTVPGEIVDTTARTHERSSVRWEFDPTKDASFLRSPPRLACTFEAKQLEWAARLPTAVP